MKIEWDSQYEFVPSVPEPVPNWALEELAKELVRLKVDINVHGIGKPDVDESWCIHQEGDVWLVYHSERGRRSGPAIFTSSFDAANFFLWKHVAHPQADSSSVGMLPRRNV